MNIQTPLSDLAIKPHEDQMGVIPRPKKSKKWLIIALVLGVIFFFGGFEAYAASRAYSDAMTGREAALAAADEAKSLDFSAAAIHLRDAAAHFASAKNYMNALAPLTVLPVVGKDVTAAGEIISSAYDAVVAFGKIADVADNLFKALSATSGFSATNLTLRGGVEAFFRLSPDDRKSVLSTLDGLGDKLNSSTDLIGEALDGFANLPPTKYLASVTASITPLVEQLKAARDQINSVKDAASLIPAISGYPFAKNYLVLLENPTELRPTGGFIGLLASVQISAGAIGDIKAEDVYAVDDANGSKLATVPPAPLAKYLDVKKWFLRDANWSPDFPTSAKQVVEDYKIESGAGQIDGVISVDISFAEDLLRIVGPITIQGSTFTADNAADEIEFQVEKGFDKKGLPIAQRKDVVIGLIYEVFKKAVALPGNDWQKVVDALVNNLSEKHVQIAPFDNISAAYAKAHSYDGSLRPYTGDTLMLVDANLGAFKTDSVMDRRLDYVIKPTEQGLMATATMTYKNNGVFSWKTTRYRDYLRLYVPAGSKLVSSTGAMENDKIKDPKGTPGKVDSYEELGRHVFGAFVSVEPKATKTISFTYLLPTAVFNAVAGGAYSLDAEKQAGTNAVPLTLSLDFGKNIKQATPPEAKANWGDRLYTMSTDLLVNRQFNVGF